MSNLVGVIRRSTPKGKVPFGITPEKIGCDRDSLNYAFETS